MCVGNGALSIGGMSFFAAETVLAGLAYRLTGSAVHVGLLTSFVAIGWQWPQLLVGSLVEHRPRKMPIYTGAAVCRVLALVAMAAAVAFWRGAPGAKYWVVLLLAGAFTSFGGMSVVSFLDVTAKAVPATERPMLFSYRRLFSGLVGFFAGGAVVRLLDEGSGLPYPQNYAVCILLGAVLCAAGYAMFISVREPIEPVPPDRAPFAQFLMRGLMLFKRDADYRRFYLLSWAWAVAAMSQPLLVPYAMREFNAPGSLLGWFTAAIMLVAGISSYAWGRLMRRYGEPAAFMIAALLLLFSPLTALALALLRPLDGVSAVLARHYVWPFLFMFACGTTAINGHLITRMVYLLSLPPAHLRATYVAFMNTLTIPLLCAPVAAGKLADGVSYAAAFGTSAAAALCAFGLSATLRTRPAPSDSRCVGA